MKSCLRKVMHAQGPSHMVCFSQIEICEFPEELGDNPTTLTGVPIGLGKKLEHRVVYDVEWYESFRERRRTRDELRIPPNLRFQSALQGGASLLDIENKYKEMVQIQKNRAETFDNWKLLLQFGMDKTYHPSKFRMPKVRKYVVPRTSPRVLGGWERDSKGISSTKPRA